MRATRAVADQRALGQAGRAAGVENDEPVFGIDTGTFRRRRRGPDHLLVVILDNQPFGIAQLQRGQRFGESPRADYERGRDQVQTMLQFRGREPPILTRDDRAEISGGKLDLDVFDAVLRQQRESISVSEGPCRVARLQRSQDAAR